MKMAMRILSCIFGLSFINLVFADTCPPWCPSFTMQKIQAVYVAKISELIEAKGQNYNFRAYGFGTTKENAIYDVQQSLRALIKNAKLMPPSISEQNFDQIYIAQISQLANTKNKNFDFRVYGFGITKESADSDAQHGLKELIESAQSDLLFVRDPDSWLSK